MDYAASFLAKYGQACTIRRSPPVPSLVSMKRASNSSNPATREATWQGLILSESALTSGDLFTVGLDTFLVQSTTPSDGALQWFAVKCNAAVELKRPTDTVDDFGNIKKVWLTVATADAWGQIVTARLRQEDPGLVDGARYIFQMQKSLGVQLMDRIVYGSNNYQVESVDDIAMPGVVRVQLGVDVR